MIPCINKYMPDCQNPVSNYSSYTESELACEENTKSHFTSLDGTQTKAALLFHRPNLTLRGCKSQTGEINQRLIKLRHNPLPAAATTGIIIPKNRLIQQLETLSELEKRWLTISPKRRGRPPVTKKVKERSKEGRRTPCTSIKFWNR